ncbi:MAG: response regulator [Xanthomonadaceae bacterium]|nr:response regulator [Xanthomonadaceae bacterium]
MNASGLIYLQTDAPRILVVDGSRLTRSLIAQVLGKALPRAEVVACASGEEACRTLETGAVDLVTTALHLPDMDGLALARHIREHTPQAYIPIIVVSGEAQEALESRRLTDDVTDYFDKALGMDALAAFIRGYVAPEDATGGEVLYVEDSRVVAMATRRMLEKHGLRITHCPGVEEAIVHLDNALAEGRAPGADVLLTDVYLKGELSGKDLVRLVRGQYGYGKGHLPIVVMTGDANSDNQSDLLRLGANDLVLKPIDERRLVTKLMFQIRLGRLQRSRRAAAGQ